LDEHVAGGGQPPHDLLARNRGEVQGDGPLVAVDAQIVRTLAIDEWRSVTTGFVAFGRLDLDHVGAVIAEHHAAERPCQHPTQVQDAETVQRPGHAVHVVQGRTTNRMTRTPMRATIAYSKPMRRSRLRN